MQSETKSTRIRPRCVAYRSHQGTPHLRGAGDAPSVSIRHEEDRVSCGNGGSDEYALQRRPNLLMFGPGLISIDGMARRTQVSVASLTCVLQAIGIRSRERF